MNCTKEQDAVSISLTSKENRVKALEAQLQEAEIRVEHANKARAKEIEALNVQLKGKEDALFALQTHIDEELKQSTAQNATIRAITDKLANCEGVVVEEPEKKTSIEAGTYKTTAASPSMSDSAYYDGSDFYYQPSELRSYSSFPPRKRI
jgi:chromosome segregation ATPase